MGTGNAGWDQGAHEHSRVQITDLGVIASEEPPLHPSSHSAPQERGPFVVRGLLVAGFVAGVVLLSPSDDIPLPLEVRPPIEELNACQAVEQAEQDDASELAGQGDTSPAPALPPGSKLYGAMTAQRATSLIGLLHSDGSVEVCEESARRSPIDVQFPSQAELGELPEGMTYAYLPASLFTESTLVLRLQGVRLTDDTVVQSLTLADGRSVPVTPVSDQ